MMAVLILAALLIVGVLLVLLFGWWGLVALPLILPLALLGWWVYGSAYTKGKTGTATASPATPSSAPSTSAKPASKSWVVPVATVLVICLVLLAGWFTYQWWTNHSARPADTGTRASWDPYCTSARRSRDDPRCYRHPGGSGRDGAHVHSSCLSDGETEIQWTEIPALYYVDWTVTPGGRNPQAYCTYESTKPAVTDKGTLCDPARIAKWFRMELRTGSGAACLTYQFKYRG